MTLGVESDTQRRAVLAVAVRVRQLRAHAGLGADELAAAAGRPARFCLDVEAGRTELTYLDLLDLAGALGVPPATLLADEPPAPPRPRSPD